MLRDGDTTSKTSAHIFKDSDKLVSLQVLLVELKRHIQR